MPGSLLFFAGLAPGVVEAAVGEGGGGRTFLVRLLLGEVLPFFAACSSFCACCGGGAVGRRRCGCERVVSFSREEEDATKR